MRASVAGLWVKVVAAVLLVAGTAWAQVPAREHPGAVVLLLKNETVRQDLHLSSLQAALLKSLGGEYRDAFRELTATIPESAEQRAAAEKEFHRLNARFNQRALSILNGAQKKRLLEIEHQALGATGLLRPSVQASLKLSERQREKIAKIDRKSRKTVAKINQRFAEKRMDAAERLRRLHKHRVAEGKSLWKVLTPEQRLRFVQLGGTPLSSDPDSSQQG